MPSCGNQSRPSPLPLRNISIDRDQETTLAELAETLLPTTSTPGAKAVSAHRFVLTMVDDCYPKDRQQEFLEGLRRWEDASRTATGKRFGEATAAQKESLVASMETGKMTDVAMVYFYTELKRLTIQAYTTSEYFLTKVHPYELVPGRFHGCVPIKA